MQLPWVAAGLYGCKLHRIVVLVCATAQFSAGRWVHDGGLYSTRRWFNDKRQECRIRLCYCTIWRRWRFCYMQQVLWHWVMRCQIWLLDASGRLQSTFNWLHDLLDCLLVHTLPGWGHMSQFLMGPIESAVCPRVTSLCWLLSHDKRDHQIKAARFWSRILTSYHPGGILRLQLLITSH